MLSLFYIINLKMSDECVLLKRTFFMKLKLLHFCYMCTSLEFFPDLADRQV